MRWGCKFGVLGFAGAVMPWSWFFYKSQPTKPAAPQSIKFSELEFRPVADKTRNNAKASCVALELSRCSPAALQPPLHPCVPVWGVSGSWPHGAAFLKLQLSTCEA